MIEPGKVVLFRFPNTNLQEGKLRPVLVIAKVPG
jgi:mRNA interferase MazF